MRGAGRLSCPTARAHCVRTLDGLPEPLTKYKCDARTGSFRQGTLSPHRFAFRQIRAFREPKNYSIFIKECGSVRKRFGLGLIGRPVFRSFHCLQIATPAPDFPAGGPFSPRRPLCLGGAGKDRKRAPRPFGDGRIRGEIRRFFLSRGWKPPDCNKKHINSAAGYCIFTKCSYL